MANNQKKVKDFLVEDLLTKAIKDSNLTDRSDDISRFLEPSLRRLETTDLTKEEFAKRVTQYLKDEIRPSKKKALIKTIPQEVLLKIALELNPDYEKIDIKDNSKQNQTAEEKFNETFEGMLQEIRNAWDKNNRDILTKNFNKHGRDAIDVRYTVQSYGCLTHVMVDLFLKDAKKYLENKPDKLKKVAELEEVIELTKQKFFKRIPEISNISKDILETIREGKPEKVNELLVDELLTKVIKDSNLTDRSDKISKILKPALLTLEQKDLTNETFAKKVTQYLKDESSLSTKQLTKTISTEKLDTIAEQLNPNYSKEKEQATIKAINDAKNVKDLEEAFKEGNNYYKDALKKLGTGKITDSEKARAEGLAEEYKRLLDDKIGSYQENKEKESHANPKLLLTILLRSEMNTFQKSFKYPSVFKEEPKQKLENKGSLASKAKNTIGKIKEQFDKMKLPKSLGDNVKAKFNKAKSKEDGRSQ